MLTRAEGTARGLDRALVLMACSDTKLHMAHQPRYLYLGPMWQTLRTHIGDLPWSNVIVLSGKYGIIRAQQHIQPYEARLTHDRAERLIERGVHAPNDHHGAITIKWQTGCSAIDTIRAPARRGHPPFTRVIIAGAGEYRRVFEAFLPQLQLAGVVSADADISAVRGGIGEQRSQLGRWLCELNGRRAARDGGCLTRDMVSQIDVALF